MNVWVVSANGGAPRRFAETKLSNSRAMVWNPHPKILYQLLGNRNFHLLDPEARRESPLVSNDSVGWMFRPKFSPDGQYVAVMWNRMGKKEMEPRNMAYLHG